MKKYYILVWLLMLGVVASSFVELPTDDESVPYPEGYRNWTHVKTYIVGPKSPAYKFIPGFNHVYANEKAMQGYKTGYFPNGSVIVSDVIEVKEDSVNMREGKRHHIDVMVRDSIKYSDTGGWRFEEFFEDSKTIRLLTPETRTACTNCHVKQSDLVFSEYRE